MFLLAPFSVVNLVQILTSKVQSELVLKKVEDHWCKASNTHAFKGIDFTVEHFTGKFLMLTSFVEKQTIQLSKAKQGCFNIIGS